LKTISCSGCCPGLFVQGVLIPCLTSDLIETWAFVLATHFARDIIVQGFYQTKPQQMRSRESSFMMIFTHSQKQDADSTTDLLRHLTVEETIKYIDAGKQKYEWLWGCHKCGKSGAMLVGITLQCVDFHCDHQRCKYCPTYPAQRRHSEDTILPESPINTLDFSPPKLMR